jgi:hypothetical protein
MAHSMLQSGQDLVDHILLSERCDLATDEKVIQITNLIRFPESSHIPALVCQDNVHNLPYSKVPTASYVHDRSMNEHPINGYSTSRTNFTCLSSKEAFLQARRGPKGIPSGEKRCHFSTLGPPEQLEPDEAHAIILQHVSTVNNQAKLISDLRILIKTYRDKIEELEEHTIPKSTRDLQKNSDVFDWCQTSNDPSRRRKRLPQNRTRLRQQSSRWMLGTGVSSSSNH